MPISSRKASPWTTQQFWEKYLSGQKDYSQMNLSEITLYNSIFYGLCLDEANLAGAKLERITLSGTSLKKAQITHAILNNAKLAECDFKYASLRRSSLVGANLENADLMEADFSHTDLHHANLTYANLDGADFRNANLDDVKFQGAIYTEDTHFDDDFNPEAHGMKCIRNGSPLESAEHHLFNKRQQLQQHTS